ncbi:MAG: NUDIX hydrolase [Burkholderiaceae bacterium]|jgi:ADP-ribose pyrophosphatase|nr:NUDIX hydrolase [Burkholderiaceae bacterium]
MPDDDAHLIETCLSGQDLVRSDFLTLRRDTVCLPSGGQASREYLIHPGAAAVVPVMELQGGALQLVLERQYRYPVGRTIIEFPAGKLAPGERAFDCARRELREETGYTAGQWARAGQLHPTVAYSTEVIDIWFARDLTQGARQLDPGEHLDVFTATPAQLLAWCRDGTVTDAKTLAAALWLQQWMMGHWTLDWRTDEYWAAAGEQRQESTP